MDTVVSWVRCFVPDRWRGFGWQFGARSAVSWVGVRRVGLGSRIAARLPDGLSARSLVSGFDDGMVVVFWLVCFAQFGVSGVPWRPCSAWNVGGWGGGLFWLRGVRCSLFTWLGLPRSMRWVREEIVRVLRAPSPRFHLAGSHRSERGGVGVALPVLRARFLRPPVGAVGARRRVALFATRLRVTAHVTGWMWGWGCFALTAANDDGRFCYGRVLCGRRKRHASVLSWR